MPNLLTLGKITIKKVTATAAEGIALLLQNQNNDPVIAKGTANGALSVAEVGFSVLNTLAITRPANTTQYTAGDLVANSATAGSVVPLQFTVSDVAGTPAVPVRGVVTRVRARFDSETLTSAQFRLHLYSTLPTPVNGDNVAWKTNAHASYLGFVDVTVDKTFTNNAVGVSAAAAVPFELTAGTVLYGLVEALATYTPTSAEVLNFTVDGIRK